MSEAGAQADVRPEGEPRGAGSAVGGALRAFLVRYPTLVLLALLMVIFSLTTSTFLSSENLTNLISVQSVTACMAFAAIVPLIAGEFDLSLGYAVGLVSACGAYLAGHGWAAVLLIVGMFAVAILIGVVNGVLTVRFRISAFIATLGVGILVSGLTQGLTGGQVLFKGIPPVITDIGQSKLLSINISVWLAAAIAIVLVYVLEHTPLGRQWYAIGGSERVAFLAGVRTGRLKILAFVTAGLLVACAAVFQLGQAGAASPAFGPELLLPAYAAAFLSVVSYRPGYFNIPGAVIAIALLAVGFNGLSLLGVPFWAQPVFNGVVLLAAVLTARSESRQLRIG